MENAGSMSMGGELAGTFVGGSFSGEYAGGAYEATGIAMDVPITPDSPVALVEATMNIAFEPPDVGEVDAHLIETMNQIGAKVLGEFLDDHVIENVPPTTLGEPLEDPDAVVLSAADQVDESPDALYIPSEWTDGPASSDLEQPQEEAVSEPSLIESPVIDPGVAEEVVQPTPAVANIIEAIGDEDLLPETDVFNPMIGSPVKRVLYSAQTSPEQTVSTSQEVFKTLIIQRGASPDGTSSVVREGQKDGVSFVDNIQYVVASPELTLLLHNRTYPQSGENTAEVVATSSIERYLEEDDDELEIQKDKLRVTWVEAEHEYELEWKDSDSDIAPFPPDVEIALQQTFAGRWQVGDSLSDTVVLDAENPEIQPREDSFVIMGVHKAIDDARPSDLKPEVSGP